MNMSKHKRPVDENILKAIDELKWPLINKQGGKVFLRYDFEITSRGFLDCDTVYILFRFPDEYYRVYTDEDFLRVTTISGATDVALDVLEEWKYYDNYKALQNSVGRLPKARFWVVEQQTFVKASKSYRYDVVEEFVGIPLRMVNKKGNKAHIEFYLDFNEITETYDYFKNKDYEFAEWLRNNCMNEIPIDITFHSQSSADMDYAIPTKDYVAENGYDSFWIQFTHSVLWNTESSKSNRSFTLMVRD